MLDRLADQTSSSPSPTTAARLADEVMELALIAATEQDHAERRPDTDPRSDLIAEVQEFVQDNLGDPGLDAERIAAEFYVSTRTLHRLFARHDLTVAGWIKARRLDACRRALASSRGGQLPISQVAARHGFVNASFFSREFASCFGMTPREYRDRSRG